MKAAVLQAHGDPVRITQLPRPSAGVGEVLIRVEASGVNPLDTKIRAGTAAHARHDLPAILGIDLAGTIETVAEDITGFAPGDRVYGMTGGVGGLPGSLAEYTAVDARLIAIRPRRWTAREAAAAPLAVITAWEGLVDRAAVKSGQCVLVHGGAGGVGHIAIQLAASRDATVYATGTGDSLEVIKALGAIPIDYKASTPAQYVERYTGGEGFDVIFDTVGGATLDASFESVRPYTGHVISSLGWGTHNLAPLSFRGATYSGVFTLLPLLTGVHREHHGEILRSAATIADAGGLTPILDPRSFTLKNAHEAHMAVENGSARGKVVVDISKSQPD
jgi:NADPH:quinone reductase-like Zn-dependent oxidoreductase